MKYFRILLMALAVVLAACDNTDIELFDSPLAEGTNSIIAVDASSVSMLTFSWTPLDGVYQYGYKLIDPHGQTVRQGVTSETKVTLERLEAATAYHFEIEAYGANNVPTRLFSIDSSTPSYVQLAAPNPEDMSKDVLNGVVVVSWEPVDHAQYYEYLLTTDGGATVVSTGTVQDPWVELGSLTLGQYTIEVQAMTDEEGYLMSDITVFDFSVSKSVVRTYQGVYTSYAKGDFPATLNIYEDGSWVIESYYGVPGYNLELSVDEEEGPVSILNAFSTWGSYKYTYTGLDDDDYYLVIYEDPDYTCFYEDEDGTQVIMLCVFLGADGEGGYDYFKWTE